MTPPIFTVGSDNATKSKAQVHLLPCRIQHDGSVEPVESFWNPTEHKDGVQKSYLRGRKLLGKPVKLPAGYYGSVASKTEPRAEKPAAGGEGDEDAEDELSLDHQAASAPEDPLLVGALQGQAVFDEVTVWGHEATVDAESDPYVRSMEEWIAFSDKIHSYSTDGAPSQK